MGIKRKVNVTYTTDRGDELELNRMSSSHLMNAIAHHQKQIEALEQCLVTCPSPTVFVSNIQARINGLHETVTLLFTELSQRDPNADEDEEEDY